MRTAGDFAVAARVASMGPPLKAAENQLSSAHASVKQRFRFNGAAAKSSGKCGAPSRIGPSSACFNGAAAKSSGKFKKSSQGKVRK